MARVSIGMPVYNGGGRIREAIGSILSPSFGDFRLIISDNASDDTTSRICREVCQLDRRVACFRNEKNIGAEKNFECVSKLADSPLFIWAAHDDLWYPNHLATQVALLDARLDAIMAFSTCRHIDLSGKFLFETSLPSGLDFPDRRRRFLQYLLAPHHRIGKACLIYALMRRSALENCPYGPFDAFRSVHPDLGADVVFVLALLATGPAICSPEV